MSNGRDTGYWIFVGALVVLYFLLHLGFGVERMPDLLTVAVLFAARRLSGAGAAAVGLLIGVLHDSLALTAFGIGAVVKAVIGFAGARSRDLFVGDSFIFMAAYLFLGKWLHDVLFGLIARDLARGSFVTRLLVDAPINAAYAALAGLLALLLYRLATSSR